MAGSRIPAAIWPGRGSRGRTGGSVPGDRSGRISFQAMVARRVRPATAATVGGLVAVGAAQAADVLTFVAMIEGGGLTLERNPLVAAAAARLGLPLLVVAKVALVSLIVAIATIIARRRTRLGAAILGLGTLAGLVGAYSNVLALS